MIKRSSWFVPSILTLMMFTLHASAQKGVGESAGIARQASTLTVVPLLVEVVEIKTGPCEKTTGLSPEGSHIIARRGEQELNIHLGPSAAVEHVVAQLAIGSALKVEVFQTPAMPMNSYIAKSLTLAEKTIHLRDHNLRPSWAYVKPKDSNKIRHRQGACW